ncbi:hypothetical protein SAMN04489740_3123 [Arthrobacter alpinus]|uniref:Uncharacterized protein n=1 Tax=Arthrobacter alpinus TaxID=656366 RepID=A0A1H5MSW2_9MICC|nr:hypothetical protein [Arthrobacter alpinus]SEE92445.1 hypothetical protein SAMN04489740_3123 [Arthrobacter alpinus]
MGYPGGFAPGPLGVATAGPSADAVVVVAQRLAGVAQELDALRLRTAQLDGVDWHSVAAEAFRKSLDDVDFRFINASKQIGTAVELLGNYAEYLRAAADPVAGGEVCWRANPGIGPGWGGNLGTSRVWPRF